MEKFKLWWRRNWFDACLFACVGLLLFGAIVGAWARHQLGKDCMTAGYAEYRDGFCVRQVKGTDEMIPYKKVAP